MNLFPLLGLLALAYAGMVVWIALKKPAKLWDIAKIRGFRKVLGDKGTVIFFYVWAVVFVVLGVWLFTLSPS